jgi:hypothetical protein
MRSCWNYFRMVSCCSRRPGGNSRALYLTGKISSYIVRSTAPLAGQSDVTVLFWGFGSPLRLALWALRYALPVLRSPQGVTKDGCSMRYAVFIMSLFTNDSISLSPHLHFNGMVNEDLIYLKPCLTWMGEPSRKSLSRKVKSHGKCFKPA